MDLQLNISDVENIVESSGELTVKNLENVTIEDFKCTVPKDSWFKFLSGQFDALDLQPFEKRTFLVELSSQECSKPILLTANGFIDGDHCFKSVNIRARPE
jgi:hypothetical protein